MFYGRLQPQPATLAVRVLFLMGGVLGLAGMTGVCAGQTPAGRPPSTNRAAPKTSPPPPKVVNNPSPLGTSGKSARKAAGAESLKTATPRIPSTAGGRARQTPASRPLLTNQVKAQTSLPHSKVVHNPSPRGISGEPSREVRGVGAESLKPMVPRNPPIAAGRRDPFKAWVTPSAASHAASEAGPLPAGTRGLVISGLRLEGIVRQEPASAMIAVVTNYTKRAYFLRVNDAVYNGVVSKITPEAVYFKENTLDSRGRVATHEVEIKLGSAPGEGR